MERRRESIDGRLEVFSNLGKMTNGSHQIYCKSNGNKSASHVKEKELRDTERATWCGREVI